MPIYLIAYDLSAPETENISMLAFLNTIGTAIPVLKNAAFVATGLTTQEIHIQIHEHSEYKEEWVITKLDKEFTGSAKNVDALNYFLKSNQFK
ncbi:hypothetical protein BC6307_18160 [Sutcliffiella cohnii]|uniref:Uncharacterized protein n=1 Tax=Sutcliffiella cohnii TaxID=33932 RepID=A0A223KUK3_9BACI|nr:hypothetical protein [Sutcliffiella cohnii]AST93044.1 hypothetical protein BC6307_18160 [Sutcliffiella cohnii]